MTNQELMTQAIMPGWIKRGYWSQSTNMPLNVRGLATIEETEAAE